MCTILLNAMNIHHYSEVESPIELHGTVFENQCYVQENMKKDLDRAIIKTGADKSAAIIVNDYIHAVDQIKKEHKQKFRVSPLARHTPKIITRPVRGNFNIKVHFGLEP